MNFGLTTYSDCIGECPTNQGQAGRMMNNNTLQQAQQAAELFKMDVMPNPTNNDCFIAVTGLANSKDNIKIEVSNSIGQLITELYNAPSNSDLQIRFDTKNLSSGMYFIKTTFGGQIAFKKLIIQH